jgi:hypothetical protein
MSPIRDALRDLIVEFHERPGEDGSVEVSGVMRFGAALEGPPGRLHGGLHAYVRTFPILGRLSAHLGGRTYPCALDVHIRRPLVLETLIPFEASYRADERGWELTTRFDESDRLVATARSLPEAGMLEASELARLKSLYATAVRDESFRLHGVKVDLAPELVLVDSREPLHAEPASHFNAMTEPGGVIGPPLISTQLDAVGAIGQATRMRHPHFTTRIELVFADALVPERTDVIFLADRTTLEENLDSEMPKVEIRGERWGTARVRVALVDASFERAYATGLVTVHPVDPSKFEPMKKLRALRDDSPG